MGFDLDREQRRKLGYRLIDSINDYFSTLPDRNVQLPLEERTFGQLKDVMPEIGESAEAVLDEATRELIDKGFHVPSANYFGLMNPTPTYMAVLAEALVAALNPQLATLARSQLASKIESETVRWIAERVVGARSRGGKNRAMTVVRVATVRLLAAETRQTLPRLRWLSPHTFRNPLKMELPP